MPFTFATLPPVDYEQLRYDLLRFLEERGGVVSTRIYQDGANIPTVGVGFNLRDNSVMNAVLTAYGFSPIGGADDAHRTQLNDIFDRDWSPTNFFAKTGVRVQFLEQ